MRLADRFEQPYDGQIHASLLESAVSRPRFFGRHMKADARMPPGQLVDDAGNKSHSENHRATDPHLACGRVGKVFDVTEGLSQLVERNCAATEKRVSEHCRGHAVAVAVEQPHPQDLLHLADGLRNRRL